MADIVLTAANVLPGSDAVSENGIAGATITAGQVVYLNSTTNQYGLADSNSATAAIRAPRGIALNGASAGQPLAVQREGTITIGGTLTAGVTYYLSDTPGGICAVADVGSAEYSVILGMATTAAILDIDIQASGVAL